MILLMLTCAVVVLMCAVMGVVEWWVGRDS